MLNSLAVVLEQPEHLALAELPLDAPAAGDVVIETLWSGVSAGTERLLFTGRMPPFPGMGYPLVPGYESVGRVVEAGPEAQIEIGAQVFVPGARCFGAVRGLHGGAASRLVAPASRVVPVPAALGDKAVLLALTATAYHALAGSPAASDCILIVGHGVLGRLLARLTLALGGKAPIVWEKSRDRVGGAVGYEVTSPNEDNRVDYRDDIRRQRRLRNSRSIDAAAGSGRRDRSRRLLRSHELWFPAGIHARGSHTGRGAMARWRCRRGRATCRERPSLPRWSCHPPPPCVPGLRGLPDRFRGSLLPQDGSGLEVMSMSLDDGFLTDDGTRESTGASPAPEAAIEPDPVPTRATKNHPNHRDLWQGWHRQKFHARQSLLHDGAVRARRSC